MQAHLTQLNRWQERVLDALRVSCEARPWDRRTTLSGLFEEMGVERRQRGAVASALHELKRRGLADSEPLAGAPIRSDEDEYWWRAT